MRKKGKKLAIKNLRAKKNAQARENKKREEKFFEDSFSMPC
jgi:hypothetical protein